MPKSNPFSGLPSVTKTSAPSEFSRNNALGAELAKLGFQPVYLIAKGDMYYRPPMNGYTSQICEAARYSKEEADRHLKGSRELRAELHHPNFVGDLGEMLKVEELFARHEVDLYDNYERALKEICMRDWMDKKRDIASSTSATSEQRFRAAYKTLGLSL